MPGEHYRNIAHYVHVLRDPSHVIALGDILSQPDYHRFTPFKGSLVDLGFTGDRIWLKLPLRHSGGQRDIWYLALNTRFMDQLEAYWVEDGNAIRLLYDNNVQSFSRQAIVYRHLTAPLELDGGAEGYVLIGYSSSGSTALPLSIETPNSFLKRVNADNIKMAIVYTFLATMILYSAMFFFMTNSWVFITAALYAVVAGLYTLHMDGLAFQYLWPDAPEWNVFAALPLGYALTLAGAIFTWSFLHVGRIAPKSVLILKVTIVLTIALMASSLWIDPTALKKFAFPYTLIATLVFTYLSYEAYLCGQPGARFFTLGWAGVAFAVFLALVANFTMGPLPPTATTDLVRIAIIIEISMFALAVGDQFLALRRQRDSFMQGELAAMQEKLAVSRKLIEMDRKHAYARALVDAQAQQMASAGHDLRQPLMVLKNGLEEAVGTSEMYSDTGVHLRESVAYLEALIVRYLDPEVGKVQPVNGAGGGLGETEIFPISIVLKNVKHMFQNDARKRGLAFRSVMTSAQVKADPIAVMRIVSNFVSNAVKYTKPGSRILLGCRKQEGHLRVAVYDEGQGIPASELEAIILPGVRGEGRSEPGNGMGLAIAKAMADDHGFALIIRSEPGRGSLFAVDIPLA